MHRLTCAGLVALTALTGVAAPARADIIIETPWFGFRINCRKQRVLPPIVVPVPAPVVMHCR